MSVESLTWAFNESAAEGHHRLVLLVLANMASDHDLEGLRGRETCWPGIERIARQAKVSESTAKRAIRALKASGEVVVIPNAAPTGRPDRKTNVYVLPHVTGGQADLSLGSRGVTQTPNGGSPVTPDTKEIPKRESALPSPDAAVRDGYPPAFTAVWDAYPRKVNKKGAYRAWLATVKRRGKPIIPALLLAAERYGSSTAGREERFMLHASTFFGPDERWEEWTGDTQPDASTDDDWMKAGMR